MVFVDTGAWYSSVIPDDPRHANLVAWLKSNPLRLLTTDYVIDETLTLLRSRREQLRAIELGRRLLDLSEADIHYVDRRDVYRAWELFRERPLRGWSFTDCTSLAVIERLHIKHALSFDRHFTEFAGVTVLP